MQPDPFDVLHITPDAPPEVISAAYRALAKLYHPDRKGQLATSRMAAINAAFERLLDPSQRIELAAARRRGNGDAMPPAGLARMAFGKHRGERLADVPGDYLAWLAATMVERPELQRDARAVLAWRRRASA